MIINNKLIVIMIVLVFAITAYFAIDEKYDLGFGNLLLSPESPVRSIGEDDGESYFDIINNPFYELQGLGSVGCVYFEVNDDGEIIGVKQSMMEIRPEGNSICLRELGDKSIMPYLTFPIWKSFSQQAFDYAFPSSGRGTFLSGNTNSELEIELLADIDQSRDIITPLAEDSAGNIYSQLNVKLFSLVREGGVSCIEHSCGNGVIQNGEFVPYADLPDDKKEYFPDGYQPLIDLKEQCDPGSAEQYKGCTQDVACLDRLETENGPLFCQCEYSCGNGVLEPDGPDGIPGTDDDEECDDGLVDPEDTYHTEDPDDDDGSCVIDDARLEYSCKNNVCGDGYLDTATEECDDGNPDSGDGCDSLCEIEFPRACPRRSYCRDNCEDSYLVTADSSGELEFPVTWRGRGGWLPFETHSVVRINQGYSFSCHYEGGTDDYGSEDVIEHSFTIDGIDIPLDDETFPGLGQVYTCHSDVENLIARTSFGQMTIYFMGESYGDSCPGDVFMEYWGIEGGEARFRNVEGSISFGLG